MAKTTAGLDAVNIAESSLNIFQSETSALVPFLMGFNAKNQMRRDAFLTSFIPKVSQEQIQKYGGRGSLGDLESAIYKDTRSLSQIVDESVASYRSKWENQKQLAESIRLAAQGAIRILEARSKAKKGIGRISEQQAAFFKDDIRASQEAIKRNKIELEKLKAAEAAETDIDRKIALRASIMDMNKRISRNTDALTSTKATLIANNIFDFNEDSGKSNNHKTFAEYIDNYVYMNLEKIKKLEANYMQEYGCIPQFLKAFRHIVEETGEKAFGTDMDIAGLHLDYEKDIVQYIALLNDGPVMIQQIARMFPQLVRNLDSEKALYAAGKGNFLHGSIDYKDTADMFRGRNKFHFSFLTMLGDDTTTPTNDVADRLILSIFGPPGVGKTASVKSIATQMGYLFKSISIPHADSSVFAGLPAVNEKDQVSQIVSSDMYDTIYHPGVIDLEEATAASDEAVKSQMARFLQNGEIGLTHQMHPLSVIVMTANDDIHHNRNIELFSTVIMNRIRSVYWKNPDITMNGWVNWIMNDKSIQSDQYDKKAHDFILSFLLQTSDGAKYWMPQGSNETSLATPSPRAWHNLAQEIGVKISNTGMSQQQIAADIERSAAAIVGPEAARALSKHYLIIANIPSVHEMLDRMKGRSGESLFGVYDAVRIFDMNNSELYDRTKGRGAGAQAENDKDPDKNKNYRFAIEPDKKSDEALVARYNDMQRRQKLPDNWTAESLFMPLDELKERYNRVWGNEHADLNNTAVLFYFTSEIIYELDRIFDDAWKAKQPVDGKRLDDLFKLAMTLPAKDPRQALIIKMMNNRTMTPDKVETLHKYGLYYKNKKGEERTVKCVLPDMAFRDGTTRTFNIKEEQAKNTDPNTVILETVRLSAAQNTIFFCSKAYNDNNNEKAKDKPKNKAKTGKSKEAQEPEVEETER